MDKGWNRSGVIAQWLALILAGVVAWKTWPSSSSPLPQNEASMTAWLLPGSLILALVLTAGLHLAAALISRRKTTPDPEKGNEERVYMTPDERQSLLDERKIANQKRLEIETAHEPCERTISNLQSQVRSLLANEQTQGFQIGARQGQIEQLQAKLNEREWLWSIASQQAETIYRFVSITDCRISQHELFGRNDPYIEFLVTVSNRSVYDVALLDPVGRISFKGREFTEGLQWKESTRVVTWSDIKTFTLRQKLTIDDRVQILNGQGDFTLGVEISAAGHGNSASIVTTQALHFDNDPPTNAELLRDYPKLAILVRDGLLASFIVNLHDWAKGEDSYVTMPVTIKSIRPFPTVVESVELKVTTDTEQATAMAEHGEAWQKLFIDEQNQLCHAERKLNNLADRLPLRMTQADALGDFQFIFRNRRLMFINNQNVGYELILTDRDGEQHKFYGVINADPQP